MSDDVIKLVPPEGSQSPEEALEHFTRLVEQGQVERVLILFREPGETRPSFICGTKEGNYTVADTNWDIDQFKMLHLMGEYEPMD